MHARAPSLLFALSVACCVMACGGKVFVDQPTGSSGAGGSGGTLPNGSCEVCFGLCTDLAHDAQNCGACGHDCPLTEICEGGHCLPTPCSVTQPCASCCGDKCCGLEELCCGNASIGFSCISAVGETSCPVLTCNQGC